MIWVQHFSYNYHYNNHYLLHQNLHFYHILYRHFRHPNIQHHLLLDLFQMLKLLHHPLHLLYHHYQWHLLYQNHLLLFVYHQDPYYYLIMIHFPIILQRYRYFLSIHLHHHHYKIYQILLYHHLHHHRLISKFRCHFL